MPNFDEISQSTAEIGKRRATILEYYFRFRFWSIYSHRHIILYLPAKFRSYPMIVGGVMTSYPFVSRWRSAAILDLIWVMWRNARSAINCRYQLGPQTWKFESVDELKRALTLKWGRLSQNVINQSITEWRQRLGQLYRTTELILNIV